jgi:pyridinium-3,5-biscarboxylic acid mononucleotide sulfurtransferase
METERKYEKLKEELQSLKRVVVAFSGGVDSTFLLKVALDVLGAPNVLALIAASDTYPQKEVDEAGRLAVLLGADHMIISTSEMEDAHFLSNPKERCYYCKGHLFDEAMRLAKEKGFVHVVEGSNADDLNDFRPGRRAIAERNVRSPLLDAGLTKDEIRQLSKEAALPTHDKPSYACLASRIPYGTRIDKGLLERIERSEDFIRELGIAQVRVRSHGEVARLEVPPQDFERIMRHRQEIVLKLRESGFTYVTLDLQGFRTGSMNEVL